MPGKRKETVKLLNSAVKEVAKTNTVSNMLRRDVRAESIRRIESAARTQADFEKVAEIWDLEEANRREKDKKWTVPLQPQTADEDTGAENEIDGIICTDKVFPIPFSNSLRTRYWWQVINGNFIDYIHDCMHTMHLSVMQENISDAINSLNDNQKEILYMMAIDRKSPKQIAYYRGQTSRNIHKVYRGAIHSIHNYLRKEKEKKEEREKKELAERKEMLSKSE